MPSVTIPWDLTTARVKMGFMEMELAAQKQTTLKTAHMVVKHTWGKREAFQINLTHFDALDLDECASGTHGCDVNAECNNILGSYNCTCIYGFNGNGTNCTEKVWSITICERKPNRIISCENERKIDAVYANFGRLDRVTCVHGVMSNTNCRAVNSLSTVQTKCNGKVSCELAATNSDFGDPCAGTYKYLEVKFKCVL
ncbi:Latrophilin Cirl, partial [Stylophora pistillata]